MDTHRAPSGLAESFREIVAPGPPKGSPAGLLGPAVTLPRSEWLLAHGSDGPWAFAATLIAVS